MKNFKKSILTILLALPLVGMAQDVRLKTQAQVNGFTHTSITGNLRIQETTDNNITSLAGLRNLTSVGGYLSIRSNDALNSLSGLDDLTFVGGYLYISYNAALSSLSGLDDLTSVGGNLTIQDNTILSSLSGLEGINRVGGNLIIDSNPALSSLSGLDNLNSVEGRMTINSNPALSSLSGLDGLNRVGGDLLSIRSNTLLSSLSGLEGIASVGGNLIIDSNPALSSLSGLDNLTSVGEYLTIHRNAVLSSLSGLDGINRVGGDLRIWSNAALRSLNGLENITTLEGNLYIGTNSSRDNLGNPNLANLCGIRQLITNGQITGDEYFVKNNNYNPTYVESCTENITLRSQAEIDAFSTTTTRILGNLTIIETTDNNITNLTALRSLRYVGGALDISSNAALTSLNGLEALNRVGGELFISSNNVLSSLSGLENITILGESLYIGTDGSSRNFGNPKLGNLCGIRQLITNEQITNREYFVYNNGYNPSYAQIQETDACSVDATTTYLGDKTFRTQAEMDAFPTIYTSITGNLTINDTEDNNITNLTALRNLRFVGGYLYISSNAALTSLSGLDGINSVGSDLTIGSNAVLTSLSGLENITILGRNLYIGIDSSSDNVGIPNLANFCGVQQLITNGEVTIGEYFVRNNAYNPTYIQMQDAATCYSSTASVGDFIEKGESIAIFPNPAKDILHIKGERSITFIEIINMLGQVVLKTTESKDIHIGFLPSGVYFVKVTDGLQATLVKILKD